MTPKEALQMIQDNLTPRVLGIFPVEFHIVKEALDCLELLEKENQDLKLTNQVYIEESTKLIEQYKQLKQENQDLKEDLRLTTIERNVCENIYEALEEKYFKLKKIIEIIINKRINVVFFKACKDIKEANIYRSKENKLTQQEYDLLKEALG